MKKSVIYLSLVILVGVLSCRKAEKEQRIASSCEDDCIARIEIQQKAEEDTVKEKAEQARLDSLHQDSISRIEKLNKFNLKPFINKWKDGSYLKDFKEIKSFLTKKGFKIVSKKKERIYYESDGEGNYWTPDVYTFIKSEIEIKVFSNCNDCPVQDIRVILATDEIKDNILRNTVRGMNKKGSEYYSSNSGDMDVIISTKGKTIFLNNTL